MRMEHNVEFYARTQSFDVDTQQFKDSYEYIDSVRANVGQIAFDTQIRDYGDFKTRRYSIRSNIEIPYGVDVCMIENVRMNIISRSKYSVRVEVQDESI